MKKRILQIGLFILPMVGFELILFSMDTGKYLRLLKKISIENSPTFESKTEIRSEQAIFNSESLFVRKHYWAPESSISNRSEDKSRLLNLYGISDTVHYWNAIEWRTPICKTAGGYSCGPLCGHGNDSFYFYLFGFWIPLFHGMSWVA